MEKAEIIRHESFGQISFVMGLDALHKENKLLK
jgi:hypothetical protein